MKFLDLLRLSSSSLWKRKVRTLLTVLGVTIGVASIVVMVSLGLGLNKSSMEEMESYGSLTAVTVNMAGGNGFYSSGMAIAESTSSSEKEKEEKRLDDELVETLKSLPHVNLVSPVLNVDVIAKSGIYEGNFRVQGMTAEDYKKILQDKTISPLHQLERQYGVKLRLGEREREKLAQEAERTKMGVHYLRSKIQQMLDEQLFQDDEQDEYELEM